MTHILFSAPVIACLMVAACAAFGVSIVLRFLPEKLKLKRKISQAEKALVKPGKEIASQQVAIKQLQEEVERMKPLYERLNSYYEQLTEMHVELEDDDDCDDLIARRKRYKV